MRVRVVRWCTRVAERLHRRQRSHIPPVTVSASPVSPPALLRVGICSLRPRARGGCRKWMCGCPAERMVPLRPGVSGTHASAGAPPSPFWSQDQDGHPRACGYQSQPVRSPPPLLFPRPRRRLPPPPRFAWWWRRWLCGWGLRIGGSAFGTANKTHSLHRPVPAKVHCRSGHLRQRAAACEEGAPSLPPSLPARCWTVMFRGTGVARVRVCPSCHTTAAPPAPAGYLVDPASSHMLVSKIKPCMSKYKRLYCETANGSLNQLWFI